MIKKGGNIYIYFNILKELKGNIELISCGSESNYVKSSEGIYVWGWYKCFRFITYF